MHYSGADLDKIMLVVRLDSLEQNPGDVIIIELPAFLKSLQEKCKAGNEPSLLHGRLPFSRQRALIPYEANSIFVEFNFRVFDKYSRTNHR